MSFTTKEAALVALLATPELQQIESALKTELYLVGGTVRDVLSGSESTTDFDLAANLPPAEILSRLQAANIQVIPTGLKHQTVMAVFTDSSDSKLHVEITSLRTKKVDQTVGVGNSIEEDLSLRDFTINAIAFSFNNKKILDPLNGILDIQQKIIRGCLDSSERFKEDPLRTLRAVRFASTLNYELESETKKAIKENAKLLSKVSVERIREELEKIILGANPRLGFELLKETELLEICLPEIIPCVDCAQNSFHSADVFVHTLDVIDRTRPDLLLRLSALFHDIGKPHTISIDEKNGERHFFKHETVGADITKEALTRLKFPNDVNEATTALVRLHMRPTDAGTPGLRRILRDTGDLYPIWRELKEADTLATNIDPDAFRAQITDFDERIAEIKKGPELSPLSSLALKGADLLKIGVKEGPIIGVMLRHLHEKVLDTPEINNKENLLEILRADFVKEFSGI
jgi:tRNA nucleotidyltransferase (CCA-adding enzyme)